jgi:hypothetical protein
VIAVSTVKKDKLIDDLNRRIAIISLTNPNPNASTYTSGHFQYNSGDKKKGASEYMNSNLDTLKTEQKRMSRSPKSLDFVKLISEGLNTDLSNLQLVVDFIKRTVREKRFIHKV